MKEARMLTIEEAIKMLPDAEGVHTFRNPDGVLVGCTWFKTDVIALINKSGYIALSGETATSMGHGMTIYLGDRNNSADYIFIETKESKK